MRRRASMRWLSALAIAAISSGTSWAYFTSVGSGTSAGSVTSLSAPTISGSTPGPGTVTLTWGAVTPPGSGSVSYYVTRNGGAPGGNCPTSSSPASVTSCTDSGLAPGTYSYGVTAVWRTWTATSSSTNATVTTGVATQLSLSAASTTPTAGVADNLTVTAKDLNGNTATGYTGSHSLTFGGASDALSGTRPTATNSSGTATNFGAATAINFTNGVASVTASNNGVMKLYKAEAATITVTDGTISNGAGASVTVSAATASKLAFTQQPSGATGGTAFTTQPKVAVQDPYGNTVTTDTSSVTLAIGTNPGAGTLTCTANPQAAISGEASFSGCKIDKAGTGYTLKATDGALTLATSGTFNVTVGPAAKLGFTQQVAGAKAGIAFTTQPKVAVQDAGGNTVTTDTSSVTLAIGTNPAGGAATRAIAPNPAGGTLTCPANPLAATAGVASFAGCKINNPATGYTLTATDGSLTSATSASFEVTPPPLWVANGATTTWTTNTAGTVALPASLSVNDLMLLIVANTANNTITTAPTGWTSVQTVGSSLGAGVRLTVYRKFYAVTDTAPSVTPNADTGGASARIAAFRYVNTTTPLDVTAATSSSAAGAATFTPTGQTTVTTNARAESIVVENDGGPLAPTLGFGTSQGFSFESGFPESPSVGDTTNNHAVGLAGPPTQPAGAVTFPTYSTSSSVPLLGIWAGISIALRP